MTEEEQKPKIKISDHLKVLNVMAAAMGEGLQATTDTVHGKSRHKIKKKHS